MQRERWNGCLALKVLGHSSLRRLQNWPAERIDEISLKRLPNAVSRWQVAQLRSHQRLQRLTIS